MLQNRNQRLQETEQLKRAKLKQQQQAQQAAATPQIKPSDKYIILKFNREFDQLKDELFGKQPAEAVKKNEPHANDKSVAEDMDEVEQQ